MEKAKLRILEADLKAYTEDIEHIFDKIVEKGASCKDDEATVISMAYYLP